MTKVEPELTLTFLAIENMKRTFRGAGMPRLPRVPVLVTEGPLVNLIFRTGLVS